MFHDRMLGDGRGAAPRAAFRALPHRLAFCPRDFWERVDPRPDAFGERRR